MSFVEFSAVEYAAINWQGRRLQIEHQWISPERHDRFRLRIRIRTSTRTPTSSRSG